VKKERGSPVEERKMRRRKEARVPRNIDGIPSADPRKRTMGVRDRGWGGGDGSRALEIPFRWGGGRYNHGEKDPEKMSGIHYRETSHSSIGKRDLDVIPLAVIAPKETLN